MGKVDKCSEIPVHAPVEKHKDNCNDEGKECIAGSSGSKVTHEHLHRNFCQQGISEKLSAPFFHVPDADQRNKTERGQ